MVKSRILLGGLSVAIMVAVCVAAVVYFASCTSTNHTLHREVFCDGRSVSLILTKDHTVWCSTYQTHSGRYQKSVQQESWLVSWPLIDCREGLELTPALMYAGTFKATKSEPRGNLVSQTGDSSHGFMPYGDSNAVLHRGSHLRVLEHGTERNIQNQVPFDPPRSDKMDFFPEVGPGAYTFSRDRKHVFSWQPTPAIYAIPDMTPEWKSTASAAFTAFQTSYRQAKEPRLLLTNDLAYLVAMSSVDALCYDLRQDMVFTFSLKKHDPGSEELLLDDAESTRDGLRWLLATNKRRWGWNDNILKLQVVDSQAMKVSVIDVPPRITRDSMHTHYSWDPGSDTCWMFILPGELHSDIEIEAAYARASVIRHNIRTGERVTCALNMSALKHLVDQP